MKILFRGIIKDLSNEHTYYNTIMLIPATGDKGCILRSGNERKGGILISIFNKGT